MLRAWLFWLIQAARLRLLDEAGVPYGATLNYEEAFADPHVRDEARRRGLVGQARLRMSASEQTHSSVEKAAIVWLFVPIDLSVLYTRRPETVRAAFSLVPDYLRTPEDAVAPNLMDYGVSLGRRFRTLKLWMVLRAFGTEGIAERIREHVRLAAALRSWIEADPGFELLAPSPFSLVCFRARFPGRSPEEEDRLNDEVVDAVNATGEAFLSPTRLRGRTTLRLAIGNIRTEERHVRRAFDLLRAAAAARLGPATRPSTGGPSVMQDAPLEGRRHRLRPVVHPELAQNAADEPLGRPPRDVQRLRDLDIRAPLGHELQHVDLAGGQAGSRAPIRELARHLRRDPPQARVHRPDGRHELKGQRALEQVSLGPGPKRLVDVLVAVVDGQGDEPAPREFRTDGLHGLDPVQHRKAQVDEGDVGTKLPEELHRLLSIPGFADDGHVALCGHYGRHPLPHQGMVVRDQDPD